MATKTTATATDERNTPEALLQEQRAAVIHAIRGDIDMILEPDTRLEDLLILRDILSIASASGSVLTGIGSTLNRKRPDAVWVRLEHEPYVAAFISKLESADDTLKARKPTTVDADGERLTRNDIMHWLGTWSDIRLAEWWQLGLAVSKNVSAAKTPVENAIVEMGGSYWLSTRGNHECTLETLRGDLNKAAELSRSLYEEERPAKAEKPEVAQHRADLEAWLDTWAAGDLRSLWELGLSVKNHRSNATTPVEDFIRRLGEVYGCIVEGHGTGVSFETIQRMLDEAKEWFDEAVDAARYIQKRYPEALRESGNEAA